MAPAHDRFDHVFIAPRDFERAARFYRDGLKWRTVAQWGGDGAPRGLVLDGGAMQVVIAERHPAEDHSWSHGVSETRPTLHLEVDDLDARFASLGPDVEVVVRPEATHWGARWFVVTDGEGNLIAYNQRRAQKA